LIGPLLAAHFAGRAAGAGRIIPGSVWILLTDDAGQGVDGGDGQDACGEKEGEELHVFLGLLVGCFRLRWWKVAIRVSKVMWFSKAREREVFVRGKESADDSKTTSVNNLVE